VRRTCRITSSTRIAADTVPSNLDRVKQRIVIAVDGSPGAQQAVAVGLDLAAARSAEVVFVHFSSAAGQFSDIHPNAGPTQDEIEEADPVLRAAAEAARERDVRLQLETHDEHGTGDIAAAIAGIAEGREASLIVVGTRGRGALTSAVLGSVSRGLLGLAPVPVVVVHDPSGS